MNQSPAVTAICNRFLSRISEYFDWKMEASDLAGTYAQIAPEIYGMDPSRIIAWAGKNGTHTETLISRIIGSRRQPPI
jgi:hypothetical protein